MKKFLILAAFFVGVFPVLGFFEISTTPDGDGFTSFDSPILTKENGEFDPEKHSLESIAQQLENLLQ